MGDAAEAQLLKCKLAGFGNNGRFGARFFSCGAQLQRANHAEWSLPDRWRDKSAPYGGGGIGTTGNNEQT